MGCDIHFKIERRVKSLDKPITYYDYDEEAKIGIPQYARDRNWNCVNFDIKADYGERDYWMFACLAGVRGWYWAGDFPKPKGLPDDMSDHTKRSCCLIYDSRFTDEYVKDHDYGHLITKAQYESLSKSSPSDVCEYTKELIERNKYEKLLYCPDFHSHSWVTREEFEEILDKAYLREIKGEKKYIGGYAPYLTLLGILKAYELEGLYETRLVFWFDN